MTNKPTPITLEKIEDPDNLRLALDRISRSIPNKWIKNDRDGINRIKEDEKQNLRDLSIQIKEGYNPTSSLKVYIPKSFIQTRIITILSAEDEIVYQSIINLLAQNAYSDLEIVQEKNSYGNRLHQHVAYGTKVLGNNDYKTFFLNHRIFTKNWKEFNRITNKEIRNKENKKKLETDITSFFDSVPHYQLINVLQKYGLDEEVGNLLSQCLNKWNGTKESQTPGVGIPTGPIASTFLSNIYLMPVDLKMIQAPIVYIRYVDDFKLFTRDGEKLYDVGQRLGLLLNGLGLTLKSSKTHIEDIDHDKIVSEVPSSVEDMFTGYDPNFFIDDKEYQEQSLPILVKNIKEFFMKKNDTFFIKDEKHFFKRKHDAVLSQILVAYKKKIIQCRDRYGFAPDESLIEIIFFLIDKILDRSHVYIPFLSIYSTNIEVRNRIFSLLERRMTENMEWVRYFIYLTLREFELDRKQSEHLLSIFEKEELWPAEKLYELLRENCFINDGSKKLAIAKIWDEKCKNSFFGPPRWPGTSPEIIESLEGYPKDGLSDITYKEDIEPICIELESKNPDELTPEEKKIFFSKSWPPGQSTFYNRHYNNKVLGKLISYLRAVDRTSILSADVPRIAGENISPFWSAASLRILANKMYSEAPEIKRDGLKVMVVDSDGNINPTREKLDTEVKKIPI